MPNSRTLDPEDRISRYCVVESIGTGGMGEVYLARDETLRRVVALKILPPRLMQDEERVRRFIREARSTSSLSHPNIVAIYEIGFDRVRAARSGGGGDPASDPIHFIAMELVQGETLARKIHASKDDLRTLLGWLAQAADGIAKAHAAGVVHRDLKPGNIMITGDGFAKVLDFGLAKLTERESGPPLDLKDATESFATCAGAVVGTPGYMSPEQVLGKAVDARSDVFSMGCVLYEIATRRLPFVADTPIEVMHRILRDPPAPVEEVAPEVPAEVRRIIRRCLAKTPDQRFQSMKDLALELHEVHDEYDSLPSGADGPPIRGAAPIPSRKLAPTGANRRRVAIGIAAAMMVVALAAALRSRSVDEASARGALMTRPIEGAGESPTDLSRDGRIVTIGRFEAPTGIFTLDPNGGDESKNIVPVTTADPPLVSPDGSKISYSDVTRIKGRIVIGRVIITSADGAPVAQIFLPASVVVPVGTTATRWAPDSEAVTYVDSSKGSNIMRQSITGGSPTPLTQFTEGRTSWTAWSPDGEWIAVARHIGQNEELWIVRPGNGESRLLTEFRTGAISDLVWTEDSKNVLFTHGTSGKVVVRISD